MDHFAGGVHQIMKKQTKRSGKMTKKGLKVVYISSPMKFKTCASNFRALVQELTGKDSDADIAATHYMQSAETSPTGRTTVVDDVDDRGLGFPDEHVMMNYVDQESPTCTSDSLFDRPFDHGLILPEGSFLDMFTSSLLNDSSSLDVLRDCKFG